MMSFFSMSKPSYYIGGEDSKARHEKYESLGKWYGGASRALKLCNLNIVENDFNLLCLGYSLNKNELSKNAGSSKRNSGWDCTFSAPKSFSLLLASASNELQEKLLSIHERSVKRAIDFAELYTSFTRRGSGGERLEKTAGLLVACFLHISNRELQPQFHTHALVLNLTLRLDGDWGAVDPMPFMYWQKALGALYRAELAYKLSELGIATELVDSSFHIIGVPKDLCERYSKRSRDIKAMLEERGLVTSSSPQGNFIKSIKPSKSHSINYSELKLDWKNELAQEGIDEEFANHLIDKTNIAEKDDIDIDKLLFKIGTEKAIFSKQDLFYEIALVAIEHKNDVTDIEAIVTRTLEHPEVVKLKEKSRYKSLYTTELILAEERCMVSCMQDLAKRVHKALGADDIELAINTAQKQLGEAFEFDDEQVEAICSVLMSGDISIVQGSAGAGKTTILLAVKIAYESKGLSVHGACIAKKAADNLAVEAGIPARTIASLISKIENNQNPLNNVDVLIIDEAGLVPCTDLLDLAKAALEANCKIVLSGEDKQLDSISRAGALRYLSLPEVLGTSRIETIKRQNSEWGRQTVEYFREGKAKKALKALQEYNCLHWAQSKQLAIDELLKDYFHFKSNNPEKSALVIAHNWEDVKALSEAIRTHLYEEGGIGKENISVICSVANRKFNYEFSKGDRVRFTRNDYRKLNVTNGTLGVIHRIEKYNDETKFHIRIDDGRIVSFSESEYRDEIGVNVCLAYALTVYSSQGTTVNGNTFVLFSSKMDRPNTYVAMSRHKDESHIYISQVDIESKSYDSENKLKTLSRLMKRNNYSSLAIEYI